MKNNYLPPKVVFKSVRNSTGLCNEEDENIYINGYTSNINDIPDDSPYMD